MPHFRVEPDIEIDEEAVAMLERLNAPKPPQPAWVYFIAGGDLVKIGIANDVARRHRELQMASPLPLRVVATIAGTEQDIPTLERRLHVRFAAHRRHGEWFAISEQIAVECALEHGGERV